MWTMRCTCVCTLVVMLWSAPTRGRHHLRRGGRQPSAGAQRRAAGRHDPPPGGRRVRRQLRAAGEDRRRMDHHPHRGARHGPAGDRCAHPARARAAAGAPAFAERVPPRCAPRRARTTGTSATSSSRPNQDGLGDIIQLGDGSSAQNTLAQVPHHIVLESRLRARRSAARAEARHRAQRRARDDPRLAISPSARASGRTRRRSAAGTARALTSIENNYLEAAGENVHVRRRRSRDPESRRRRHHRSAATTSRARWRGATRSSRRRRRVAPSRAAGGSLPAGVLRLSRRRAPARRGRARSGRSTRLGRSDR